MNERRWDLDWLRVLVFGLLIFYHIGMLYVADWGYHYKSSHQSGFLQNLMIAVNRWRLPLLFLIAGVAMRYLLHKVALHRFALLRSWRLLLPLFFGVLVIVPPQLYCEMIYNGDLVGVSYGEFYRAFFDLGHPWFEKYPAELLPHMDVNHLWFIRELWWFSMLALLLLPLLNWSKVQQLCGLWGRRGGAIGLLLIPAMVFSLLSLWVFPQSGEGVRIWSGFAFFIGGYLMAWNRPLWAAITQHRRIMGLVALITTLVLLYYYHTEYKLRTEPLTGWSLWLEYLFIQANRWAWLLVVLGYAQVHLNRPGRALGYLNEAVYPYYILHQSLLIVAMHALSQAALGPVFEPLAIIAITFAGCALLFEVIRRVRPLRVLFGLKWSAPRRTVASVNPARTVFTHVDKSGAG